MKCILLTSTKPSQSFNFGTVLSAILTFTSLGVAVWALEAAEWVNPLPSLLLTLALGVIGGAILAWNRLKGPWAFALMILGGFAVAIIQSVVLFPAIEGLSVWSRWFAALTQPAGNSIAFIIFLVAVSWFAGSMGTWYAVRRRSGWPALVFGSLIVTLNLVNLPRDFTFTLPLYLILGLVLVAQTRWSHGSGTSNSPTAKVFAGLGLCVVIVLGAFVLPESPAESFNLNVDGGSLYSAIKHNTLNIFSAVPSKVKTVRSSGQEAVSFSAIPDQSDAIRFIINSPTPGYFQTRNYDIYTSSGWSNGPLTNREIASGQAVSDAVLPSKTVTIRYEVENAIKTDLILVNGQAVSFSIPVVARSLPGTSSGDIMAIVSPRLLTTYQPYTVTAYLPTVTADDLFKSQDEYSQWLTQRYLQLPGSLPPSIPQLSQQLTRGYNSSYAKVLIIKRYLQNLAYDINGADVLDGSDGVAYFLSSRQGNCVNFASALVVLLRSAGVPARFCQGYLGTEVDDDKHLVIRGKDAHAWAEVYFPEYGWIIVEATPGRPADNFDPATVIIPGEIDDSSLPVIPGNDAEDIETSTTDDPINNAPKSSLPWQTILLISLFGTLIVVGGGGTLYLTRASDPRSAYVRLGWIGKIFRLQPGLAETPLEYARRLGIRFPNEARDIDRFAKLFARMRYGSEKGHARIEHSELSRDWRLLSQKLLRRRLGLHG
jgi:hypothetical protein